jgi:AraC-like DNA-binding protein
VQPRLALFAPPYDSLQEITTAWTSPGLPVATALVWRPDRHGLEHKHLDFVEARPRGYSLIVVLPPPSEIHTIAEFLPRLGLLRPHAVLPSVGVLDQPPILKSAFALVPRMLPDLVSFYLDRHRIVTDFTARKEIRRIFELAPKVTTVAKLCREMYTSRRTLGRHFEALRLPVPSHWLQFARILHVAVKAHDHRTAFSRLAVAAGYPDGFTMSNQMKRLIGYRPSEMRELYGYEWIIEAWLQREAALVGQQAIDGQV